MSEKYIRFAAEKLSRAGFTDIQYVYDDEQGADILACLYKMCIHGQTCHSKRGK